MFKRKIIITEDGSTTIELIGKNEQFHSTHGAIQESEHIYIQMGLAQKSKGQNTIRIFEMGFGTGLNALLSLLFAIENNIKVDYFGIEAYPVEQDLFEKLNYTDRLDLDIDQANYFALLHDKAWESIFDLHPNFVFKKSKITLEQVSLPDDVFDVIYFDAFNPDLQPELWTEDIFKKLYQAMKSGGVLMTYSAKGKVKRALKAAGFVLKALPGPIGKREISQAIKP